MPTETYTPQGSWTGGELELIYGSSDTVEASSRFGHLDSIDHDGLETPNNLKVISFVAKHALG